jgi:hypothetical protein
LNGLWNYRIEEQAVVPKLGRQKQSEFHLFQHLVGVAGIAPDSEDDGQVHMDCIHSYNPVSITKFETSVDTHP